MKAKANWDAARAYGLHTRRKEDRARPYYESAYRGGTTNSGALSAYSLLLIRDGDFQKALDVATAARRCTDKPKQIFNARSNRGLALWKLGRVEDAVRIYERLFAETQSGTMYGTLGFLYIALGDQTGDYEKALEFNEKAVEYDDEDAVVLDNLAQTYMRLGRWQEAEAGFRKALERKRDQFDSLACLAECLLRRGEEAEGRKMLRRALERPFSHLNTVDRAKAEEMQRELDAKDAEAARIAEQRREPWRR